MISFILLNHFIMELLVLAPISSTLLPYTSIYMYTDEVALTVSVTYLKEVEDKLFFLTWVSSVIT